MSEEPQEAPSEDAPVGDPVPDSPAAEVSPGEVSPGEVSPGDEAPPPPVEGGHDLEPIVLALVFLVPPIALGGSAIALAFAKELAWNPLAVGLVIGLVASIGFYFVVRRVFAAS